jgi:hypothetical protein
MFQIIAMARVKSTAWYVGGFTTGGSDSGGHESGGSERMEFVQWTDVGSHSEVVDVIDKGSHSRSYFFGASIVKVSRIHKMIDGGYFAQGMGRKPGEETVPEPNPDEAVVLEEFFTSSLWMPPHHVLSDILLKFQVEIYQLTPNAIVQLSKYIWAVVSFGDVHQEV